MKAELLEKWTIQTCDTTAVISLIQEYGTRQAQVPEQKIEDATEDVAQR